MSLNLAHQLLALKERFQEMTGDGPYSLYSLTEHSADMSDDSVFENGRYIHLQKSRSECMNKQGVSVNIEFKSVLSSEQKYD